MNKFYILTLGCKVNAYESSAMREILLEHGYIEVDKDENCDVCIINTCSVTHVSDAKSRQMIRKMIKQNPNCIIANVSKTSCNENPFKLENLSNKHIIVK